MSPSSSPSPSNSPPVSTGSTIIGQIFKAPDNNINSVSFTAESGQEQTELDNLETGVYANNAALQLVWVKAGTNEAVRETTIKASGSNMSMKLDASKANGEWEAATNDMPVSDASIDMTNAIISFQFRQNNTIANLKGNIFLKDSSSNKSVFAIVIEDSQVDSFVSFSIPISSFTSGTPADITDIASIGFEVDKLAAAGLFYIDTLTFIVSGGTIRMKLWDFGATLPVAGTSKLSDATQYETIGDLGIDGAVVNQIDVSLLPGKRLYHIHDFSAGPAFEKDNNSPLTTNNYYALTFHHVDEDVILYGNNEGRLSTDGGFSFTAEDEATAIEASGEGENLQFYIFCVKQVYLLGYHLHMLDVDGASALTGENNEWTTTIEDANGIPIMFDEHHHHSTDDYFYDDTVEIMELGSKFVTKYVSGVDDIVEVVQEIIYLHQKVTVVG